MAVCALLGCQPTNPLVGSYVANISGEQGGITRELKLDLNGDSSARLSISFGGGSISSVQQGTWKTEGEQIQVRLTQINGRPLQGGDITFEIQGRQLVSTKWDPELYGADGLKLVRP